MNSRIAISKIKILFLLHEPSQTNIRGASRLLNVSRNTVRKYLSDINNFRINSSIKDRSVISYLRFAKERYKRKPKYHSLFEIFPSIIESIERNGSNRLIEWRKYRESNPEGYSYTQFAFKLGEYCKQNALTIHRSDKIRVSVISPDDMEILRKWKRSSNKSKWEKATVLFESLNGNSIATLSKKIERGKRKLKSWIKSYEAQGLKGLERKPIKINEERQDLIKKKKENLIKLLHESPQLHGINRASWSLKTLSKVFRKIYKEAISTTTISEYFKAEGFKFVKARKVLTSPDPKYREKLAVITGILSRLGPKEKFFSVDEFGPFSIKIQGGRSFVKKGMVKTFPQRQISKGTLICTAALELSNNQVTHFYSDKKNTEEMIRLLELLLQKYKSQEKIYFSWDAASWHASKRLYERIDEINELANKRKGVPHVELAPLPASAQFLNVIESIFSGLARAIIHNSNYTSVEECKKAIDRYFEDRNTYFKNNPKRAGNKIWGKERNPSVFDESKNFKDLVWR